MSTRITSEFDITKWDEEPYDEQSVGPELARATVQKTFSGDLEGESTAELLMCKADPDDYTAGAGYLASEQITGRLEGRRGTFVVQHGGLSDGGIDEHSFGHVVPGSGTDELAGIRGDLEIEQTADGGHTLTLNYHFNSSSSED